MKILEVLAKLAVVHCLWRKMLPYRVAFKKKLPTIVRFFASIPCTAIAFLGMAFGFIGTVQAQQSSGGADSSPASSSSGQSSSSFSQGSSGSGSSLTPSSLPTQSPTDSSTLQLSPPSVTLPTPALPPLGPIAEPTPSSSPATPEATPQAAPTPAPTPQFSPPTALNQNLPSAQPAGNPTYAPASVGMPSLTLDNSPQQGVGALGGIFDWAQKLRFQASIRGGYDNNINSAHGTNAITSTFSNLNGGVNYRFGAPRLSINLNLTGGITRYFNPNIVQPTEGTLGLGIAVEYRLNPRTVLSLNSSSSYQQQPNIALVGTANNSGTAAYYYTANSLSDAYQISDLYTSVTTLSESASYYPNSTSTQTNQSFSQPSITQSIRYLARPTTTAVVDYNAQEYLYKSSSFNSFGQYLALGFDHSFNPKWFWNFRMGAQTQSSKTTSLYIGPYVDSNFNWVFGNASSIGWVAHIGTQPSGTQNLSYLLAGNTGINYSQGLFSKLRFNAGLFYQISQYKDAPVISVQRQSNGLFAVVSQLQTYYQTNIQGNASLAYQYNRIFSFSLGYQYMTLQSPTIQVAEYNRGISYFQVSGDF